MSSCDFDVILGMNWLSKYHVTVNHFIKEVVLKFSDYKKSDIIGIVRYELTQENFPADLIVLSYLELNVTLSMNWLTRYWAMVNSYTKEIILELPVQVKVAFYGERQVVLNCLVSTSMAFYMIKRWMLDIRGLCRRWY